MFLKMGGFIALGLLFNLMDTIKSEEISYRDKTGKLIELEESEEMPLDEDRPTPPDKSVGRAVERSTSGPIPNEKEVSEILSGIASITVQIMTSGSLVILKKDVSFPILTSPLRDDAKISLPVVGGAQYGKGRMIIYASDMLALLSPGMPNPLLISAIKWTTGGGGKKKAVILSKYNTADLTSFLKKEGYSAKTVSPSVSLSSKILADVDVVINAFMWDLTPGNGAILKDFIFEKGGGFVGACNSWHRNGDELKAHYANVLIGPAGLFLITPQTDPPDSGVLDASLDLLRDTHTHLLIDELAKMVKTNDAEGGKEDVRYSKIAKILKFALEGVDDAYIPWLSQLTPVFDSLPPINPTAKAPVKASALKKLQVDVEWIKWMKLEPKDIQAHPAHADFPGAVKPTAVRVASFNRTIPLDQRHALEYSKEKGFPEDGAEPYKLGIVPHSDRACIAWCSSTMYAPAGEVVEIILHSDKVTSFTAIIGPHNDDLRDYKDNWTRYPKISYFQTYSSNRAKAASPFGGLIYVSDIVAKGSPSTVTLEVKGAVATNTFIFKETPEADWNSALSKNNDAPFSEFVSERLIFSVPSGNASLVKNPDALMTYWVTAVDAMSDMAGYKPDLNFHRVVFDRDITKGVMHSGNPIMGYVENAMTALDLETAYQNGWVFLHELGHNHIQPPLRMDGMMEVTNLIFATYVRNVTINMTMIEANWCNPAGKMLGRVERYLKIDEKTRFNFFKRDGMCGIADVFFYQLELSYGWEPFKKMFRAYRKMKESELPNTDEEKWDTFFVTFSTCVGKNLKDLFTSWSIPLGGGVDGKVAKLPMADETAKTLVEILTKENKEIFKPKDWTIKSDGTKMNLKEMHEYMKEKRKKKYGG